MNTRPKISRGFTLAELAIVLIIVALLTSGVMMSLTAQQEVRQLADVQRQLAEIRESLLGHAMAYGRLPCPAKADIASGLANAGTEDCSLSMGVLPWATLGVPETDPWGRRYTYRVTDSFRDPIVANTVTPPSTCTVSPTQSSFALCSEGNITITDGATNIATKVPAVVISHGRNGRGGYLSTGDQISGATGDEAQNVDNNTEFVSRTASAPGTPTEFDDVVTWIPLAILLSRMVAVGRLP